jgi:hypothetical protein
MHTPEAGNGEAKRVKEKSLGLGICRIRLQPDLLLHVDDV